MFEKLFKITISKKTLLYYLTQLESKRSSLVDLKPLTDKELLTAIIVHNSMLQPKEILQFFGFKKALESMSLDELKKIVIQKNNRNWLRFMKALEQINVPTKQNNFAVIRKQIENYQPLKMHNK